MFHLGVYPIWRSRMLCIRATSLFDLYKYLQMIRLYFPRFMVKTLPGKKVNNDLLKLNDRDF